MRSMIVEFRVAGVTEAADRLKDLAATYRELAAAQKQVSRAVPRLPAPSVPAASPATQGANAVSQAVAAAASTVPGKARRAAAADGGGAGGVVQAAQTVLDATQQLPRLSVRGPYARLVQAHHDLRQALVSGTNVQVADAQAALRQAQARVDRAQGVRPLPVGPLGRLRQAQDDFSRAQASGDPLALQDAQLALRRAQLAADRGRKAAQPRDGMDWLNDLVNSSRVGFQVGGVEAMPLVNRLLSGAGATGMAGPIGAAVLGIASAGEATRKFAEEVSRAAERARSFSGAASLSGGSTEQVTQLASLGMRTADIASLAEQFRQRTSITSGDPFGIMAGARLTGGLVSDRQFGSVNDAEVLLRALEGLRGITDSEERLREARRAGLEWALKLVSVSDKVWQQQREDFELRKRLYGDTRISQAAKDLAAQTRRVSDQWEDLRFVMLKSFIPQAEQAVGDLADAMRGLSTIAATPQVQGGINAGGNGFWDAFVGALPGGSLFKPLFDAFKTAGQQTQQTAQTQQRATQKLVDAINANTAALKSGKVYGGGQNASGAIPSHLSGEALRRAIEANSLRLGYWNL